MERLLDQLIQLQELYFAQSEQESLASSARPKDLERSIQRLIKSLPSEIASLCQRLRKRDVVIAGPVVDGVCSACGVALPISHRYEMETTERVYQCPCCSRLLYGRPGVPRQLRNVGRSVRPNSGVARFSSQLLMLPSLKAETREEALSELVNLMAREGFVENTEGLLRAALEREALMTTAVNNGLAFPHVRGVEGGGLTFSLGLKREGLDFGAPDNGLTHIFFFIVIPSAVSAFFLQLLSGLVQAFQDEPARRSLLEATTPDELWERVTMLTEKAIP